MKLPLHRHYHFLLGLLLLPLASAMAQDAATFFQANCVNCHTIGGGRLTGPDLKNIAERREADWIERFIRDPAAMINAGDADAVALTREYRGVVMPRVSGLTLQLIQHLRELIAEESALEKSRFAGLQLSDRPLTDFDVAFGDSLFRGFVGLSAGGPPCIGCHHTAAVGWLGGGQLGPDLSQVYGRLGGRKALANWLGYPGSPTMQPLYLEHPLDGEEILPLVAYLQDTETSHFEANSTPDFHYLILGLIGTVILLVLSDVVWGGRLRNVRRALLKGIR